jgi:hypothetical protein
MTESLYAERVQALEAEGLTTSDAQAVIDCKLREPVTAALSLIDQATRGRFDLWELAGSHNARVRAVIMARLLNVPKVPQARAGVTALEAHCCGLLPMELRAGECPAVQREHFATWARDHLRRAMQ